jgi:hypothetical protein
MDREVDVARSALILLGACIVSLAHAADSSRPQADQQLDEVLVDGRRPVTDTRKLIAWIDRLVGQFDYAGTVDRHDAAGIADQANVRGNAHCTRFGKAMAVQCVMDGESPSPAVIVYGLDSTKKNFGILQVDGNGLAMRGKGWVVDDTLVSKEPCADFPDCQRVFRLEAPRDGKGVRIRIDLEQAGQLRQRQDIQWKRVRHALRVEPQPAVMPAASLVPADIDAWLRRLQGKYRIPGFDEYCSRTQTAEAISRAFDEARPTATCPTSAAGKEALKNRPPDAECRGIGSGPGVRCAVNMDWPEDGTRPEMKWYQTLKPHFLMYGFDPVHQGIAVVLVSPTSNVGAAGFTSGLLKNDKLAYSTECAQPPCTVVEEVSIAPGGEWLQWQISQGPGTAPVLTWRLFRMPR